MEHQQRIAQLNRALSAVATGAATILLTGDHSRALMFKREVECAIVLGTSLLSACVANGPPSAENLMQPTQVDLRVINGGDSSIIPTESQINVHNDFMSAESEGRLTFFNNQGESVEGNLIDFASNFLNPAEITSDVILTDVPPSLITFGETPIALQAVGFQAINPDTNQPMIKYSVFAQVGDQGPWTLLVTPENPDDESIGFSQVAGGVAVTKPINLVYLFNNEEPIPQPWIITGQNGQPFIAVIRPNGDGHGEFISADHRLVANDIAQDMSTPEARKLARRAMAKIALPTMTPTTEPDVEDPTVTLEATTTINPYESLTNINPSELTIESFLNAMPADVRATHENPSAATQEQKNLHDQWISNAWKAVFNNLTDGQLAGMNLNRVDIGNLGLGPTGQTYTETDGKDYPVYNYSLLRAIESFSQEFNVYQAPFMINLGEQIKVDPANWISSHTDTATGRGYGYGSNIGGITHDNIVSSGIIMNNYFGKQIIDNKAQFMYSFSGDLPLVFDYPGYQNSYVGLVSMRDTDANNRVERYGLVLVNFGQGPDMYQITPYTTDLPINGLRGTNLATHKGFDIKTIGQLLAIIENSYTEIDQPPHVSYMGGRGQGGYYVIKYSHIPFTGELQFYPDVQDPNLALPIPIATVTLAPPPAPAATPTP